MPGCRDLLEDVIVAAKSMRADQPLDVEALKHVSAKGDLPMAFQVLEDAYGREQLLAAVQTSLSAGAPPGPLGQQILDLPFAGYVTTNYDQVLETGLSDDPGWVSVGNTAREVPKISGDVRKVVWHLHGDQSMGEDKSRLVLTRSDYDAVYLDDSPAMRQFQGLLGHRRVIFLGFSFVDQDLVSLLKRVGRLTDATRPAYAFVPAEGEFKSDIDRKIFLKQHNIDVIPYKVRGESHRSLLDLVEVYSAMAIRCSITFGRPIRRVPEYDPETTGLLIYNELVGREGVVPEHMREPLLDSRILALLANGPKQLAELVGDISSLAQALGHRVQGVLAARDADSLVRERCVDLQSRGLLAESSTAYQLAGPGQERLSASLSRSELMSAQFRDSLRVRAARSASNAAMAARVGEVAAAFLEECVQRRALGVAMALAVDRSEQQGYHMVALMQGLKDHIETVADPSEAANLLAVVQGALSSPTESESTYLGTVLQARFGVHLLGFDQDTIAVRTRDLAATAFVLDATTLIPALARGSVGNEASLMLLGLMRERGCPIVTTDLLVREASEHARWAQRKVAEEGTWQSAAVLEALLGRHGERSNDFLQGFVRCVDDGICGADFREYMGVCFGQGPLRREVSDADVAAGLEALGVTVLRDVNGVDGFSADLNVEFETLKGSIATWRQHNGTWTHERQVTAEAEALVLVRGLRAGQLSLAGGTTTAAYFISHSQFLNEIDESSLPIVLRQEAALQWLGALRGHGAENASAVYDGLVWELQEKRADIVDHNLLRRVFRPTIDAARESLDAELERYRHQIASGFSQARFADVDDLSAPTVLAGAAAQTSARLAAKLAEAEAKIYRLEKAAEANESEKEARVQAKKRKGSERYKREQARRQERGSKKRR
jgi:hypothetical protein